MSVMKFTSWQPDLFDLDTGYSRKLSNVIPQGDGYGPFHDLEAFTNALPAQCRGFFLSRSPSDGSALIFAGTANKLYLLNNTDFTWTDVSLGASTYTDLSTDANWSFCQFNSIILASQKNAVMQRYTIGSSAAFANLAGSPPQAGWIGVVGSFVVASDLLSTPLGIQWCGLDDVTNWTSGTNSADDQSFPDGGRVRAVVEAANQVGIILQENAIRRMVYAAGSDVIFQIQKLKADVGCVLPYSVTLADGLVSFIGTKGFASISPAGTYTPFGNLKVDKTFLGLHETNVDPEILALAYDPSSPQLVFGAADPARYLLMFAYRARSGTANQFGTALLYNWVLQSWAVATVAGEYLAQVARPGLTLEQLDAITPSVVAVTGAANNGSGNVRLTVASTSGWTSGDFKTISGIIGTTEANVSKTVTVIDSTHIDISVAFVNAYISGGIVSGSMDAFLPSFDDILISSLPAIAGFTTAHKLGFFSGATLEAELETAEQRVEGRRLNINGVWPVTDAGTVYCSTVTRDRLDGNETDGDESLMDADGWCPLLDEGRLVRGRMRIPAGTAWSAAAGIETDNNVRPAGQF